jgi:hypothetical protein
MKVYDSTGEWLVTYPVVFGNKDMADKMMEGDRRTPEGNSILLPSASMKNGIHLWRLIIQPAKATRDSMNAKPRD